MVPLFLGAISPSSLFPTFRFLESLSFPCRNRDWNHHCMCCFCVQAPVRISRFLVGVLGFISKGNHQGKTSNGVKWIVTLSTNLKKLPGKLPKYPFWTPWGSTQQGVQKGSPGSKGLCFKGFQSFCLGFFEGFLFFVLGLLKGIWGIRGIKKGIIFL